MTNGSLADWEGAFPFTKLVFIDSTWHQCHGILQVLQSTVTVSSQCAGPPAGGAAAGEAGQETDSVLADPGRETQGVPRHHRGGTVHSAELYCVLHCPVLQVYWVCVEYYTVLGGGYSGQCDDLLWLFKFMFEKIHQLHTGPGLEGEPFLGSPGLIKPTDKDN